MKDALIMDFLLLILGGLGSWVLMHLWEYIRYNFVPAWRDRAKKYAQFPNRATEFFEAAGRSVARRNVRELEIQTDSDSLELAYCTLAKLVPVEEVQGAFRALQRKKRGRVEGLCYLVYPGDLDPAAARQLDVYRLRENAVIIPLPLPFLEAKRNEGRAAARAALDGLRRRYLGFQDLFDVRNAIDEPRFFYGRRELLADLFNALTRGEHVALIGPRKSGKTSALNLLQQRLTSFPVVKIDLQLFSRSQDWPAELFAKILEHYDYWGQTRYRSKWKPGPVPSPLTGMAFCREIHQRRELQRQVSGPLPLILLLDEMERIFPRADADDSNVVREHVERFIAAAGALRSLGQESGERLISIIAADPDPVFNRTNRFAKGLDTNPFYRFFQECSLPPLSAEECDEMLRDIGHAMGLEIDDEVRRAIFSDSGGHAALARQLASAACRERDGAATVTPDHYRAGLEWLTLETGTIDNDFEKNLWHESSPAEKRVLALASQEEPVAKDVLEEPGPAPAIDSDTSRNPPTARQLRDARRILLATGMLEEIGGLYRARGALFRSWLRENIAPPRPVPTSRPSSRAAGQGGGDAAYGAIHAKPDR